MWVEVGAMQESLAAMRLAWKRGDEWLRNLLERLQENENNGRKWRTKPLGEIKEKKKKQNT